MAQGCGAWGCRIVDETTWMYVEVRMTLSDRSSALVAADVVSDMVNNLCLE